MVWAIAARFHFSPDQINQLNLRDFHFWLEGVNEMIKEEVPDEK